MYKFIKSDCMKIDLEKNQEKHLLSKDKIKVNCQRNDVLPYDIYLDDKLIGFAMFRKCTEPNCLFLWAYAIDKNFQNKHHGQQALHELLEKLEKENNIDKFTTTYKIGNDIARHTYTKLGFVDTKIIDECAEVDMELCLSSRK